MCLGKNEFNERRTYPVNSNELKAEMKRNNDTQEKLAEALGLQVSGVSDRINGKIDFRRSELGKIRNRYNLTPERFDEIFFDGDVSK